MQNRCRKPHRKQRMSEGAATRHLPRLVTESPVQLTGRTRSAGKARMRAAFPPNSSEVAFGPPTAGSQQPPALWKMGSFLLSSSSPVLTMMTRVYPRETSRRVLGPQKYASGTIRAGPAPHRPDARATPRLPRSRCRTAAGPGCNATRRPHHRGRRIDHRVGEPGPCKACRKTPSAQGVGRPRYLFSASNFFMNATSASTPS